MTLGLGKGQVAAPALIVLGAAWAVVELLDWWRCYRRARRERTQLLTMDERSLRDLGLSRVDALRIAEAPAWRDCARLGRASP